MLSLFCDKSHPVSLGFAEMVFHHLKSLQVMMKIQDFSEKISFSSFSILIFSESTLPLKFWGNYGVFQENISINSSTLSSNFNSYPKFLLTFSDFTSSPDDFIKILKPLVPKISNYKQFRISSDPVLQSKPIRPLSLNLLKSSTLLNEEDYSVQTLEFLTEDPYEVGANLSLYPENSESLVEELMFFQQYEDWTLSIEENSELSEAVSLKHVLKTRCDLKGLIRKPVLKTLSFYSRDSESLEILKLITSLKGKEKFLKEIQEKCLNLVDILKTFNISVPPGDLIQVLDQLKPRVYSVTTAFPSNIEVAVQVMRTGKHIGCFSEFALNAFPGKQVFGEIKKSVFELVFDMPLILIANGCGIAPFRGILTEVNRNRERFPKVLLFAGFRTADHFLYKQDFEELFSQNPSIIPLICYSRTNEKKHVQSLLTENSSLVLECLSGLTFICGGTQMGKSVKELLKSLIEKNSLVWEESRIKIETWG
jgi:sulfite reductase alpha subunit-like flavoprotein